MTAAAEASMNNGLTNADIGLIDSDIPLITEIFGTVEINQLSHEEVLADYKKTVDELSADKKPHVKRMLIALAVFIFANGIHESLKDKLRVTADANWKQLKDFWGFKSSRKQMFVRWCIPVLATVCSTGFNNQKNLLLRQAMRWDLMDDLNAIAPEFRYFGSYFAPNIPMDQRVKVLLFQKKVITLSGGGKPTGKGVKNIDLTKP